MKLNRKGYMLVEIVIASVLAISIAFFLLNLTYHFKNKNEDIQQSIYYTNDKIAITKNIMNDLDTLIVTKVSPSDGKDYLFDVSLKEDNTVIEQRKLQIEQGTNGTVVRYGKWENNSFVPSHVSYYEKTLEKSLIIGEPEFQSDNVDPTKDSFTYIKIPMKSLYDDKSYDIKLFISTTMIQNTIQYLNEAAPGSYVKYVGNNGCAGKACEGQNANYVDDSNMGYCYSASYKFKVNGWRVGYLKENSTYLISAGSPECMCTNSSGTSSSTSCSSYETTTGGPQHVSNLNSAALKYCNSDYAYNEICNSNSVWNINDEDFQELTRNIGTSQTINSCAGVVGSDCGKNYDLIENGGHYWFGNGYTNSNSIYYRSNQNITGGWSDSPKGVRPVLRLNPNVIVTGGTGTYQDPYQIAMESS